MRKNKEGSWFVLAVEDAGWVQSAEEYEQGAALNEAFTSGVKQAEAPVADSEADQEVPF